MNPDQYLTIGIVVARGNSSSKAFGTQVTIILALAALVVLVKVFVLVQPQDY